MERSPPKDHCVLKTINLLTAKLTTMKTTIFKISAFVLLLSLMGAGCEKENHLDKQEISGYWKVFKQNISGEFESSTTPPGNAIYTDISIVIPDTTKGNISGNTFFNSIEADFEIEKEQQINFKNYGGTRIAEDNWGASFRENLLNTVEFNISKDELFFIDSQNQTVIVFIKN